MPHFRSNSEFLNYNKYKNPAFTAKKEKINEISRNFSQFLIDLDKSFNETFISRRKPCISPIPMKKTANTPLPALSSVKGQMSVLYNNKISDSILGNSQRTKNSKKKRRNKSEFSVFDLTNCKSFDELENAKFYKNMERNKIVVIPSVEYRKHHSLPYLDIILKDIRTIMTKEQNARNKRRIKKELERKKNLIHFGSPFRKDKKLGIEEIIKQYKEIGRIMNKRGLISRRRNDQTFYAYLNKNMSDVQFKNKQKEFFSKSLKITPSSNAVQVKNSNNKFNAFMEKKIKDEYERRNKAKIMLQAVLVQKFASKEDRKDMKDNILVQANKSNENIAMLGKLPKYNDGNGGAWNKDLFKAENPSVCKESKLKQMLKKAMKKSLVNKANNEIMQ
ncbi:unnamed protein product [Moneuplotes crassus]|uniref:Uncharacterized protein n=1 Tax=Euplotes crassus TaxID=5936 RepID=A0AAD1UA87_EUPCR|nr:unnamed protein product [Moneuplotes crassus]